MENAGKKAMILRLEHLIGEEIALLKETTSDIDETLEKASVLKNVHLFLHDYDKNCKILSDYNYENRFDKEREEK